MRKAGYRMVRDREWTAFDHKGGKVFKITDGDGDELVLAASLKDCETWLDNVERGVW